MPPIGTDQITPAEFSFISPIDAATRYFELMMEDGDGGTILWQHVASGYRQLAAEFAWPAISEKTLSRILVSLGCVRGTRDMRSKGKGRMTTLTFPKRDIGP